MLTLRLENQPMSLLPLWSLFLLDCIFCKLPASVLPPLGTMPSTHSLSNKHILSAYCLQTAFPRPALSLPPCAGAQLEGCLGLHCLIGRNHESQGLDSAQARQLGPPSSAPSPQRRSQALTRVSSGRPSFASVPRTGLPAHCRPGRWQQGPGSSGVCFS